MSPAVTEILGYLAATLTTAAFVPQVLHTLRTRDVSGISLGMYGAFTLGIALWLAYGLALGAWPVIIANLVTLLLAAWILGLKLLIERRRHRAGSAPARPADDEPAVQETPGRPERP